MIARERELSLQELHRERLEVQRKLFESAPRMAEAERQREAESLRSHQTTEGFRVRRTRLMMTDEDELTLAEVFEFECFRNSEPTESVGVEPQPAPNYQARKDETPPNSGEPGKIEQVPVNSEEQRNANMGITEVIQTNQTRIPPRSASERPLSPHATINVSPSPGKPKYEDAKQKNRIPIFIIIVCVIQLALFVWAEKKRELFWTFMFHPYRRYEIWRFFTPSFVECHGPLFWWNLISEIGTGYLVEREIGLWRTAALYFGSALFGTLLTSVLHWAFQAGALEAVSGLLTFLISSKIMKLKSTLICWNCYRKILLYTGLFVACEAIPPLVLGFPVHEWMYHFGGAMAGIIIGILFHRDQGDFNAKWKKKAKRASWFLLFAIPVVCIGANAYLQISHYGAPQNVIWRVYDEIESVSRLCP